MFLRLADTSKALHEQENNEYKAWVLASSKVKDDIEDYEKIGQEVVIKTGKDANMAINKQKVSKVSRFNIILHRDTGIIHLGFPCNWNLLKVSITKSNVTFSSFDLHTLLLFLFINCHEEEDYVVNLKNGSYQYLIIE